MESLYRVLIADRDPQFLNVYRRWIANWGHQIVAEATTGDAVFELCRSTSPSLAIASIDLLRKCGDESLQQPSKTVPLIVLSDDFTQDSINFASEFGAYAYLVRPIEPSMLRTAIVLAMERFEELQESRRETRDIRQALQDRKIIERAKGLVMRSLEIDEPAAMKHLHNLARRTRKSLVNLADSILTSEHLLVGHG